MKVQAFSPLDYNAKYSNRDRQGIYCILPKNNRSLNYFPTFGNKPIKIAWLETLPNVTKSLKVQVKEFLPDKIKIHKEVFDIDSTVVNIPNLSKNSIVSKDLMPIMYPHLLIHRPYDEIYSLAEIAHMEDFISDFNAVKNILRKMYMNNDILFFEHGSASKTNNSNKIKSAGKSVTFAHGHFCVLPENVNNIFNNLVEETKRVLTENYWTDFDKNIILGKRFMPEYNKVNEYKIKHNYFPPYLSISYLSKSGAEESIIFLEDSSISGKQAKTPSQLLRKLGSKYAFNTDKETNWNYKILLSKLYNGENYDEFLPKIELIRLEDKIFEERFKAICQSSQGK